MATYEDMAEMIRLGAYRKGSDKLVDESILYHEPLEAFLSQQKDELADMDEGFATLADILNQGADPAGAAA